MKQTRNAECLCLICEKEKATKTNSHFVPVGFTKTTLGKRDKEEIITITDKPGVESEKHYGVENLKGLSQDANAEIPDKHPLSPMAEDYIFCPKCEDALGFFESAVIEEVSTKLFDSKFASRYNRTECENGSIVKTLNKLPSYILDVFVFSLVWRMNLQYFLSEGENAIADAKCVEYMRVQLYEALGCPKKPNANWGSDFEYVLLTSEKPEDDTSNAVAIDPNRKST